MFFFHHVHIHPVLNFCSYIVNRMDWALPQLNTQSRCSRAVLRRTSRPPGPGCLGFSGPLFAFSVSFLPCLFPPPITHVPVTPNHRQLLFPGCAPWPIGFPQFGTLNFLSRWLTPAHFWDSASASLPSLLEPHACRQNSHAPSGFPALCMSWQTWSTLRVVSCSLSSMHCSVESSVDALWMF